MRLSRRIFILLDPLLMHTSASKVSTRQMVEEILIRAGQIDPKIERIVDVNLLVGGTRTQALHHDHGREFVEWCPRIPFEDHGKKGAQYPLMGWESRRLQYNLEMACAHAPTGQI